MGKSAVLNMRVVNGALDNARYLADGENYENRDYPYDAVAELAEQVVDLEPWLKRLYRLDMPEYRTKGYRLTRDGRYQHGDEGFINDGLEHLRQALTCFVEGGAPKTANRVRFALSSALGAQRNVRYRRAAWEDKRQKGHKKKCS